MKEYRLDLDAIKGFSIIAVILYHMGKLDSGYLGVDVFFVLNGFFVVPSIINHLSQGQFKYIKFLENKYFRLAPLVILICLLSLVIGFLYAMPDNYIVYGESSFSSLLFCYNTYELLISGNYWDMSNGYSPFMHLWYLGILFQFYIIYPVILMILKIVIPVKWNYRRSAIIVTIIIFFLSLLSYMFVNINDGFRFYSTSMRAFELTAGGLCSLFIPYVNSLKRHVEKEPPYLVSYIVVMLMFFVIYSSIFCFNKENDIFLLEQGADLHGNMLIPNYWALLITVFISCIYLIIANPLTKDPVTRIMAFMGKRSYSFFIWHQVIFAYLISFFVEDVSLLTIIVYLIAMTFISLISYKYIESKLRNTPRVIYSLMLISLVLLVFSGVIYKKAGVFRDCPELEITTENAHNGMYGEYCDRIYGYDKNFGEENGKIKVLVIGNSFARDFANVILESEYREVVDISYSFDYKRSLVERVKKANVIFIHGSRNDVPRYIIDNVGEKVKIWGIGTKNFGKSNSYIYAHRNSIDYDSTTAVVEKRFLEANEKYKLEWGDLYVDFIEPAMVSDNQIRVFTDTKKFIARDCRHLTRAGAEWYAKVLPISKYLTIDL